MEILGRIVIALVGGLLLLYATSQVVPTTIFLWRDEHRKVAALMMGLFAVLLLVISVAAFATVWG